MIFGRKKLETKTRCFDDIIAELEPSQQQDFITELDTIMSNYDGPNALGFSITEYLFLKVHELEAEINKLKEEKGEK